MNNRYAIEYRPGIDGISLAEAHISAALQEVDIHVCIRKLEDCLHNAPRKLPRLFAKLLYDLGEVLQITDVDSLNSVIELADGMRIPHRVSEAGDTDLRNSIVNRLGSNRDDDRPPVFSDLNDDATMLVHYLSICVIRQNAALDEIIRKREEALIAHVRHEAWAVDSLQQISIIDSTMYPKTNAKLDAMLERWRLIELLHDGLNQRNIHIAEIAFPESYNNHVLNLRSMSVFELLLIASRALSMRNFVGLFRSLGFCESHTQAYIQLINEKLQHLRAQLASTTGQPEGGIRKLNEDEFIELVFNGIKQNDLSSSLSKQDVMKLCRTESTVKLVLNTDRRDVYWCARIAKSITTILGKPDSSIKLYNGRKALIEVRIKRAMRRNREKAPMCPANVAAFLKLLEGVRLVRSATD